MRWRNSDPLVRRTLAARLRRQTFAAGAPGIDSARREAAEAAQRLADEVLARLLREMRPDDELAKALAEYHDAKAEGFGGWRP